MWQSDHCESDDTENVIYRMYIGNFYMVKIIDQIYYYRLFNSQILYNKTI